jgi:hypothetical protein
VKSEAAKRFLTADWEKMFHQREERDARAVVFKERLRASSLSAQERKLEVKRFSQTESQMTGHLSVCQGVKWAAGLFEVSVWGVDELDLALWPRGPESALTTSADPSALNFCSADRIR